jgi:hypothetical protein
MINRDSSAVSGDVRCLASADFMGETLRPDGNGRGSIADQGMPEKPTRDS